MRLSFIVTSLALFLISLNSHAKDTPMVFAKKQAVPDFCTELVQIDATSGGRWTGILRSNAALAKIVRKRLIRAAEEQQANALKLLDHRQFKAKGKRYGLERIEETAMALRCDFSRDDTASASTQTPASVTP